MSGILRLESLTKGNTLKQGDKTPLKYRLFDADGEELNIAGKSAKVRLVYPDFLTIGYKKDGLTVAQDDTVTFTIDSVIPSRIYHVEIIVDDKFIFPSRADEAKFTVDKSSLGTETNIIEIVGVDAVARKATGMMKQDEKFIDDMTENVISDSKVQSFAQGIDAKSTNALSLSESADTLSKSVQEQFNQIVINGDSSVEAAQARVDASGQTNPTLKARLDKEHNEVTSQLAQNIRRTNSIFDIKTLGIVGDGSIDETEKLQEIVDYSRNENIKVINYDKNLVINISKPIYFDGGEDIDFGYATINKTTNTKGEGSNLSNSRIGSDGDYTVDEYNVDAHFIFRHEDYSFTNNLKTVNIHFGTTAPNKHDFAIFVPRVSYWQIENITATNNSFNNFIYSHSMWQIPKFNNIEYRGGGYLLEIANDGSNNTVSTSINANQLYNLGGKGILKLYSVAYSTFTNVFGYVNTDIPFVFTTCRGVTVNSAEIEHISNGKFAWVIDSHVTFNSPSALILEGIPDTYTNLWNIESNSRVVINAGKFPNYAEGTAQQSIGLSVDYGSHVTLNQCKMPRDTGNPNTYVGELTQGSTITIIDENGVTVRSLEGVGTMFNGRKIYNVAGVPKTGKWTRGDIALRSSAGGEGITMGYVCNVSGEFGTEQKPVFTNLPTAYPLNRQQHFGTEPPNDGFWWTKGDMVINTNPSANGVFAWVCVSDGFAPNQAVFNVLKLTTS